MKTVKLLWQKNESVVPVDVALPVILKVGLAVTPPVGEPPHPAGCTHAPSAPPGYLCVTSCHAGAALGLPHDPIISITSTPPGPLVPLYAIASSLGSLTLPRLPLRPQLLSCCHNLHATSFVNALQSLISEGFSL